MKTDPTSAFVCEDITVGPFAHGFGVTGDGRSFAFRTMRSTLRLEIYRPGIPTAVPGPDDVVAVAEAPVTDIDLDDERSIAALVRDLVPTALPIRAHGPTTVRALLGRLSAVIEAM